MGSLFLLDKVLNMKGDTVVRESCIPEERNAEKGDHLPLVKEGGSASTCKIVKICICNITYNTISLRLLISINNE